jgi:hypothetical protein
VTAFLFYASVTHYGKCRMPCNFDHQSTFPVQFLPHETVGTSAMISLEQRVAFGIEVA